MLIYPTHHYQNGGLQIEIDGQTPNVKNLYVAGEAVGGIHGKNRLMGNSLLDIIVFGRSAGRSASRASKNISAPNGLNIDHVGRFTKEAKDAGIESGIVSPKLFPDYTRTGR
jgi:succinate dehydrogenase / fumarate reductase flavoprotein subunit